MKKTILTLAAIFFVMAFSFGQKYQRIENRGNGTFINIENGTPESTNIQASAHSAMWEIRFEKGLFKIVNRWKGTYLSAKPDGTIECISLQGKPLGQMMKLSKTTLWIKQEVPGTDYVRFINNETQEPLHIDNGKLESSMIMDDDSHNAMWKLVPVH